MVKFTSCFWKRCVVILIHILKYTININLIHVYMAGIKIIDAGILNILF